MRLLCHVLHHRAPTTYGPHFLRSNPAPPPPRASPLTTPLLNFQSYSHHPVHASPCPALPHLARPPTPHPMRAAWCTSVLLHTLRHREHHGLSLHGTCLCGFPSSPIPHGVSTLPFSIYCSHLHTHSSPRLSRTLSVVPFTCLTRRHTFPSPSVSPPPCPPTPPLFAPRLLLRPPILSLCTHWRPLDLARNAPERPPRTSPSWHLGR